VWLELRRGEGDREEAQEVSMDQNIQDFAGLGEDFGFYSECNANE
jgi:hypothetical protein